ncbi:MAG: porin family protein [Flavitalea sp.]
MKRIVFAIALLMPFFLHAQFGVKGGLNFAKVSKASEINGDTKSGFHIGLLLAPPSKSIISSRTELLFSRQGYDYKSTNTGTVDLDYIQLGQLMSINITKFFSLMFGAQTAYLVSAQVDSTNTNGTTGPESEMMDLMNRVDYGYAIGAEVHPFSGLILGIRYNVSLAKLYKDIQSFQMPSFTAEDAKNNLIMISVGWRFGAGKKEDKK